MRGLRLLVALAVLPFGIVAGVVIVVYFLAVYYWTGKLPGPCKKVSEVPTWICKPGMN